MAKAPTSYAGNLARAIGQGVTFGFGDELEAGVRSLVGDRTYDEEVADIRKSISEFRETDPIAAYGSEIVGSIPTGIGLAGLALRGGLKGAAKLGALEGSIYGAGEGEGVTGTATSAALGTGLGAAGGKVAEKAFEGIAPLLGKFMKKTRGSGAEVKGSGAAELDSTPSDLGPLVREAGSDEFVPLEKKVGAPGTSGVERNINPALQEDVFVPGSDEALGGIDYLPAAQALLENPPGMNIGKKGLTGAQYLARLKNQPSVTDLELETSGLNKFLAENANRKIPVDEVLDFHIGNSPRIEMVDGGTRHAADQRMFGDESYIAQGKNVGGGYEEVVFRDAKFAAGEVDFAPGAFHNASHHSVKGAIGHGRLTSFDDVTPGAKANSESTMLEENQSDLFDVYKGGAAREAEAERLKALREGREPSLPPTNFVQLTPEKIKAFKEVETKLEDGPGYRTLNDALSNIDAEQRMLKEIESNQRDLAKNIEGVRRRNFLQADGPEDAASPELRFAGRLKALTEASSPADRMGREIGIEADLSNIIKQAVIEDNLSLNRLSNDELKKVIKLATDRSMRLTSDSLSGYEKFPQFSTTYRAPLRDDELKEIFGIPAGNNPKDVAQEDALQSAHRLMKNIENEFKDLFNKTVVLRELGGPVNSVQAAQQAKNLLPKVADKINPSLLRNDATELGKLNLENELLEGSIFDQKERIVDSKARPKKIYMDAIEAAAPDRRTAFEYVTYRQNQGKLALDDEGVNSLKIHFSENPKAANERGFADKSPEFTNPLPFKEQEQVARYQLHQMIKKAASEGKGRFYIPDYRDLASKRDVDITADEDLAPYVSRYKTPQEKVIKELKEMYPGIEVGTVDTVQPVLKDPLGNVAGGPETITRREGMTGDEYNSLVDDRRLMLKQEQPDNQFPITYIDLTPLQAKPSQVRRYKDGGKVDLRSGIGDIFRVYS